MIIQGDSPRQADEQLLLRSTIELRVSTAEHVYHLKRAEEQSSYSFTTDNLINLRFGQMLIKALRAFSLTRLAHSLPF